MGTHAASLRAVGDVTGVQATVELEGGRMTIAAGDTDIGSWPLDDIHFEPIPTGYRVAIEGEQILIELKDRESFDEELNSRRKRRRGRKTSSDSERGRVPKQSRDRPPKAAATKVKSRVDPSEYGQTPKKPPAKAVASRSPRTRTEGESKIDQLILSAERKLGSYLPDWVFSRGTFGILVLALVVMIILPGLMSVALLVAGVILVMLGAVVYTDPVLASRWLPGAMGAQHVLLSGLIVLLLGVVVGFFGT
jgi:hypothetical protein